MSLNFCMFLLCDRYVIFYALKTHIMLLQRRNVTWFYSSQSLLYSPKEVVLRYYYASAFISCSGAVMVHSIFSDYMRKHCQVALILSQGSIFSTDSLLY